MSVSKRVFVKVKTLQGTILPSFSQCLLDVIKPDNDSALVNLSLEKEGGYLLIYPVNNDREIPHALHHSPHCPFKELDPNDSKLGNGGIVVAVSIVLESRDQHVLLTRRPAHMRASPNVWVPPGGHLEPGEELLEGGARELFEETGLVIKTDCIPDKARILCLWENVYPLLLGFGTPRNHSVVVYYHIQSQYTHAELTTKMKIDPEEVGSFTWLSRNILSEIFNPKVQKTPTYSLNQHVWNNGVIVKQPLNYLDMFNRFAWSGNKLYSGAMCSLMTWYHKREYYDSSKM